MDIPLICKALGNPVRYQIIKDLQDNCLGSCCDLIQIFENGSSVADVVNTTGLAQSTVSQHIRVLEEAGLISKEKRGQWTCFFLNRDLLNAFCQTLHRELLDQ